MTADCVVHGGDLFFRSKIPKALIPLVYDPLIELAESGIPVILVPGNHERGRFPAPLLLGHPRLMVFDSPRCFELSLQGSRFQFTGFPFRRGEIRSAFAQLLEETGYLSRSADQRILCLHQAVDGCRVANHVFRNSSDVICRSGIPHHFSAVLCGHIHRFQVLPRFQHNSREYPPVIFSGSTERTSFQEMHEEKGCVMLHFHDSSSASVHLQRLQFIPLPARPMVDLKVNQPIVSAESGAALLRRKLSIIPKNAVVRITADSEQISKFPELFRGVRLRELAPDTMNIQLHSRNSARYPRLSETKKRSGGESGQS